MSAEVVEERDVRGLDLILDAIGARAVHAAPATTSRTSSSRPWYLCPSSASSVTHFTPAPSKITATSSPASLNSRALVSALAIRPMPSGRSVSAKRMIAAFMCASYVVDVLVL